METEETTTTEEEGAEERTETSKGTLRVTDANEGRAERRTLLRTFRDAGWEPGRRAEIPWTAFEQAAEQRALTWQGVGDDVNLLRRDAGAFGADARYAWPAFPTVPVDSATTSVQVLRQTDRTLPSASDVVRAIDATSAKPEVASELILETATLKQVAAVVSGIPNVYLAQKAVESILGVDLRLALNEALDLLVLDTFAGSGNQDPASDELLVSIRKAVTTILGSGYSPDTVILDPASSEDLDVLTTSGSEKMYVFGAGRFAPGQLFGLNVRISKSTLEPVVVDSQAYGRMYASPVGLASFEENAGKTNTSLVRMEGHALFAVERQEAAVRISAGT